MINYNSNYSMDNNFAYGMNPAYSPYNNYANLGYNSYCPYSGYYNNGLNGYRGNCPYNTNYYQYSPMVHCIVPNYGMDSSFNGQQASPNYGELRMRTVSIEDIRD